MSKTTFQAKKAILGLLSGAFLGAAGMSLWDKHDTEIICDATTGDSVTLRTQSKSNPLKTEFLATVRKDQLEIGAIGDDKQEAIVALNTEAALLRNAEILGILEVTNINAKDKSKIGCHLTFVKRDEWVHGLERVISSTISMFP